jgi:gliding motility-associated-like protein
VKPLATTDFIVSSTDFKGCPKSVFDTVKVTVIPPVLAFAGNDTVVVAGQPLQLNATGAVDYAWFPPVNLSNAFIANPIALPNDDVIYRVKVSTREGCYAFDSLKVKVYKTPPEIFVPTLFTPNGDGLNDFLKPVPVGISKFVYFRVYNRYGQLVYSANDFISGWDGRFKGRDQGNESFVWHAFAEDYLGNKLYRKGQTTLIR